MSTTDASRYLARADAVAGVEHVPPRAGLPEPKQRYAAPSAVTAEYAEGSAGAVLPASVPEPQRRLDRGDVLSPGERGRHASGARP